MAWLTNKLFSYQLSKTLAAQLKADSKGRQNVTKYIGVLYDEDEIDSKADLHSYLKSWQKKGKNVETFSFINIKEFPENESPENQICRKDISWYGAPKGDKIQSFLSKPFDILITINPSKKKYLHFLNAASQARFKIGLLPDELEFYDLILDCEQPENINKIFTDIQSTLDKLAL